MPLPPDQFCILYPPLIDWIERMLSTIVFPKGDTDDTRSVEVRELIAEATKDGYQRLVSEAVWCRTAHRPKGFGRVGCSGIAGTYWEGA